jgi:hypothetical protein
MSNPYEPPQTSDFAHELDNTKGKATVSLVLGVVSIFTWVFPLVGFPTSIAGLVYGIKGLGPQRRGTAIAGIVLSIIFLVLNVLNSVAGAYLGYQAAVNQH